jgi:hypothetical protein
VFLAALPAGIGYMAGWQLVNMLVGSRGRVVLVTPTPNGHLPALFGGPFHVQLGGGGCPLDRAVGMDPGLLSELPCMPYAPARPHQINNRLSADYHQYQCSSRVC